MPAADPGHGWVRAQQYAAECPEHGGSLALTHGQAGSIGSLARSAVGPALVVVVVVVVVAMVSPVSPGGVRASAPETGRASQAPRD